MGWAYKTLDDQFFLEKLREVATCRVQYLRLMRARWNKALELSSAEVERIGYQKGYMKAFDNIVSHILDMPPDRKKHFMIQCSDDQKEIQLILGQKGAC